MTSRSPKKGNLQRSSTVPGDEKMSEQATPVTPSHVLPPLLVGAAGTGVAQAQERNGRGGQSKWAAGQGYCQRLQGGRAKQTALGEGLEKNCGSQHVKQTSTWTQTRETAADSTRRDRKGRLGKAGPSGWETEVRRPGGSRRHAKPERKTKPQRPRGEVGPEKTPCQAGNKDKGGTERRNVGAEHPG